MCKFDAVCLCVYEHVCYTEYIYSIRLSNRVQTFNKRHSIISLYLVSYHFVPVCPSQIVSHRIISLCFVIDRTVCCFIFLSHIVRFCLVSDMSKISVQTGHKVSSCQIIFYNVVLHHLVSYSGTKAKKTFLTDFFFQTIYSLAASRLCD